MTFAHDCWPATISRSRPTNDETVADVVREMRDMYPHTFGVAALDVAARIEAAHAREVDDLQRQLANERVLHMHSCHDQCENPLCVMRRRAEAAEAALARVRRDLLDAYNVMPTLPIFPEDCDAATDWMTRFCIDFQQDFDAAIAGEDRE